MLGGKAPTSGGPGAGPEAQEEQLAKGRRARGEFTMAHGETDHPLERLIFFSDAVIAIAITLLIIEIDVPHLHGDPSEAWRALAERAPKFFSFFLSFLVIGRFWIGHHSAFSVVRAYSPRLMWPNLHLLMVIVAMPFASAFMGENIGQFVPTLVYNAMLLTTALLSARLIAMATAPDLASADFPDRERRLMRARGLGVIAGSALALVMTFVTPIFSQIALATIPLFMLIARRWLLKGASVDASPAA